MSSGNSTARPKPLKGHVHLVLFGQRPADPFYLEIPLRIIRSLCRHPPKYLCYLGWCVLGVEGSLRDQRGDQVNLNGHLVDRGVYYYRLPVTQQGFLLHVVVILKLTTPQRSSLTPLTLRSSSSAAKHQLDHLDPGGLSVRN